MAVQFVGNPTEIPAHSRNGAWKQLFNDEYSKNPGKIYEYVGVSSSTAANLRRDYGLSAESRTVDGELHLYVTWDPAKADEIKAGYKPKGKAKSKAEKNGQAQEAAPKATASK